MQINQHINQFKPTRPRSKFQINKHTILALIFATWLITLNCACIAHNDNCSQQEQIYHAHSEVLFDIRPEFIRSREAPIGNLITDAIMQAAYDDIAQESLRPDFAIINAGAFSNLVNCGSRDFIERGTITNSDISSLLPNDQTIVIIELSKEEVKLMLERSISNLGDWVSQTEATWFLQISSQLNFEVNCEYLPYAEVEGSGPRPGFRINDENIFINEESFHELAEDHKIKVAMPSELALDPDGFFNKISNDQIKSYIVTSLHTSLHTAVAYYFELNSPIRWEHVYTIAQAGIGNQRGRIRLDINCL